MTREYRRVSGPKIEFAKHKKEIDPEPLSGLDGVTCPVTAASRFT